MFYRQACKLGCGGIVSKRLGSPYRSGRSAHWVKVKNPKAPTVTRGAGPKKTGAAKRNCVKRSFCRSVVLNRDYCSGLNRSFFVPAMADSFVFHVDWGPVGIGARKLCLRMT